jgi:hypothetical protein
MLSVPIILKRLKAFGADWDMPNVGDKIPIVEVVAPDGSKSLWAAAVAPENAVAVVAMLVPASHVDFIDKCDDAGMRPCRRLGCAVRWRIGLCRIEKRVRFRFRSNRTRLWAFAP